MYVELWYEDQACSAGIWYSVVPDEVRRCVASDKCAMGARSVLSTLTIEEKDYAVLFGDGHVLFMPRGSSLRSTMVLGVRESNLYRLKGQPMGAMAGRAE
jgi:hypothetical protein